ncbi:MAG: M67 family metallopeptidase [Ignavibacteriae bacterium]|nr:M67 family metallopeptidase [Ignavibacteriota bacterium]
MIKIPQHVVKKIYYHGEKIYPEECVGALLGVEADGIRNVRDAIELVNAQGENRDRRYFVTAKQYLDAEKAAKEKNVKLLGFYHSHPDHPSMPSQFDQEQAIPWFIYLIVSVIGGKADALAAWQLSDSRMRFDQQTIEIES